MSKKYVHIKNGLADRGEIIPLDDVFFYIEDVQNAAYIQSQESEVEKTIPEDWYTSSFYFDETALEYFESSSWNDKPKTPNSIAGYPENGYTTSLYWDIDNEDFEKATDDASKLVEYLIKEGYESNIEIFFSGNKGYHIYLRSDTEFSHSITSAVCHDIAKKAEAVIDSVVYNKTRAFRLPNTKHQKTGLYKVQLTVNELFELPVDEIRDIGLEPKKLYPAKLTNLDNLLEEFVKKEEKFKRETPAADVIDFNTAKLNDIELDMSKCPPDMRRCIYRIKNGYFGPGQRENALIRLASYFKTKGEDKEQVKGILDIALTKRARVYPNVKEAKEADTNRVLDTVFSENWNGGAYSCKTDIFLQNHCDGKTGCKALSPETSNRTKEKKKGKIYTAASLGQHIKEEMQEAPDEYPKFGMTWLDSRVYIRPKNFSVWNAANGAGKTSAIVRVMEQLNRQKMHHCFFSMDMSDLSLFFKLATRHTEYNMLEIEGFFNPNQATYNPEIRDSILKTVATKYPYTFFDFRSSLDLMDMEDVVNDLNNEDGVKIHMAFVDYAGRIVGENDSAYANATGHATLLNDVAKRTNCHWTVLSQISREQGDHTTPIYSSRVSKDSGAWEENATFVLNFWRPFGNDTTKGSDMSFHVYIAKNRSGKLEETALGWEGATGEIFEMELAQEQDYAVQYFEEFGKLPPLNKMSGNDTAIDQVLNQVEANEVEEKEESDRDYARRTSSKTENGNYRKKGRKRTNFGSR